ncbi:hypothetical protein SVA_3511 [Sulfurifustis variabilis]|uniref:Uncharacterized protein n=2 Tax=Sulfurifustis variabilis TaxID=1675686 RepID=A0A1B4VGR3_9GAMM|nr:hypothetical protein SVA_3511 [Sulfurifustis variabilis]
MGDIKMRKYLDKYIFGLVLWLVLAANAWSATIAINITGSIDFIDTAYGGALTLSSPINGVFVADGVSGTGFEAIALDLPPSGLTLNFGPYTFYETDDDLYGSGFPLAYFNDGAAVGLDFYRTDAEPGLDLWIAGGDEFVLFDSFTQMDMLKGTLNFTPVPIPSALCLLASGLFVLLRLRPKTMA